MQKYKRDDDYLDLGEPEGTLNPSDWVNPLEDSEKRRSRHRSLTARIPFYRDAIRNRSVLKMLDELEGDEPSYSTAMLSLRLDEYVVMCSELAKAKQFDILKKLNMSRPSYPSAIPFDPIARDLKEQHETRIAWDLLEDAPARELRFETVLVGMTYLKPGEDRTEAIRSIIGKDRTAMHNKMYRSSRSAQRYRDFVRIGYYELVVFKGAELQQAYRDYKRFGLQSRSSEVQFKTRMIASLRALGWKPKFKEDVVLVHRHALIKTREMTYYELDLRELYGKDWRVRLDSMREDKTHECNISDCVTYAVKGATRFACLRKNSGIGEPLRGWPAVQIALAYATLQHKGLKVHVVGRRLAEQM